MSNESVTFATMLTCGTALFVTDVKNDRRDRRFLGFQLCTCKFESVTDKSNLSSEFKSRGGADYLTLHTSISVRNWMLRKRVSNQNIIYNVVTPLNFAVAFVAVITPSSSSCLRVVIDDNEVFKQFENVESLTKCRVSGDNGMCSR